MTTMTATDALLSAAAATTRAEMHTARLALINAGGGVLRAPDTTSLLAGDGTAGRDLLGGPGSIAIRSSRLQTRLHARLAGQCGARTASQGRPCALPPDHHGGHTPAPGGAR